MRADARANRAAVLRAARALFAERGTDVPLRTIAAEAGVGIATLYRNFPDKDGLVLAVAFDVLDSVSDLLTEAEVNWDTDPEAAWRAYGRGLAGLRLGIILPAIGQRLQAEGPPAQLLDARAAVLMRADRFLERARKAGLIRDSISAVQFSAGLAAVTRPMPEETRAFLPDLTDWLVEVYLRGLR